MVCCDVPQRRTAAVIVHYEAPSDLARCLKALDAGTYVPDRVVVVDNSECDTARARAREISREFSASFVVSPRNLGFAGGCNLGVAALDGYHDFLFVNQDASLAPGCLATLRGALWEPQHRGAVCPLIATQHERIWFAGGTLNMSLARLRSTGFGDPVRAARSTQTEWLNGCVLLVRAAAWAQLGGFDERYFLYWEDVDLSLRLRSEGWSISVEVDALATHHREQGGDGLRTITPVSVHHSIRSRLLFVRGCLTRREQLTAVPYTLVNVVRLLSLARGRRDLGVLPFFLAAARGLRQGLAR